MTDKFTEEQIEEYKKTFSLFDKEGDGIIPIKDLDIIFRSLQPTSSEAEIQDYMNKIDDYPYGNLDFPEFLSIIARRIIDIDMEKKIIETKQEFIKAVKILDKNDSGLISAAELIHAIQNLKDKLSNQEVEELTKEVKDLDIHFVFKGDY